MERITIETRALKGKSDSQEVKVRYRIREGREVQLFYKSGLVASVRDLNKLEINGQLKAKVGIYNKELILSIQQEMATLKTAYEFLRDGGFPLTSETLADEMEKLEHPDKVERMASETLLNRFREFIEERHPDKQGATRKGYEIVYDLLNRYLIVNGADGLKSIDFSAIHLNAFREFIKNEFKYVEQWRGLYTGLRENDIPKAPRTDNTVASKLKKLRAFLTALEDNDEIVKSPFKRIGTERRKEFLRETYADDVIALTLEELNAIKAADLPENLQETRNAFLLQCYCGARISDFKTFTEDNIKLSNDGFAYLVYTPIKTSNHRIEIKTPLVKSAYQIVKESGFSFRILKNVSGERGYNAKIKKILQACGIEREVKVWSEEKKTFEHLPLYSLASNKVARKTCVTLCASNSVDEYASGLHSGDSRAVKAYHDETLGERYKVYCRAFGESNINYLEED